MSASCEPLLDALKDCLLHSDCVLKKGLLPSECLKNHIDELPEQCRTLRHALFDCKIGLVRQNIALINHMNIERLWS
jgi:cytochrome c oxidase assembly factor 5